MKIKFNKQWHGSSNGINLILYAPDIVYEVGKDIIPELAGVAIDMGVAEEVDFKEPENKLLVPTSTKKRRSRKKVK